MRVRLVLVASALVVVGAAGAAPTWRATAELSPSQRAIGPELAVNPAGDAIVVWNREEGAVCPSEPAALECIHIVETTARARTATGWQAPAEVARPGVGNRPRVAIDTTGRTALLWVHDIGEDRVVQATIRSGLSGAWPNANDLSGSPLEVRNHAIALDGQGNAVAVWAQRDVSTFYVVGDLRVAARGFWEAPVALSSLSGNAPAGPALALAPGGEAVVAWIEGGQVRAARGLTTAGTWESPVTLASAGGPVATDVDVAVSAAGDAVVVWSWGANSVQAAARAAGGGWSGPVTLGTGRAIDVGIDGAGTAVAVWLGGPARNVLQSSRHRRGAARWSRPFAVAQGASEPTLAMNAAGNAVAAWTRGASRVIRTALRPAALGTWVRPTDVSGSGASAPRVGLSAASDATVVWNRARPPRVVVEVRHLTGGGPLLVHQKIPKTALVGRAATFAVAPAAWTAPLSGSMTWRFGDGTSATGVRVTHAYRSAGTYTLTVTQRDAAGAVSTLTRRVSVS